MARGRKRIVHPAGMIICSRCKAAKPYDQYHLSRKSNTGYKAYCKMCWSAYIQTYYENNKVAYKQRYQKQKPELVAYQIKYNKEEYYAALCNVLWKNARGRYTSVMLNKGIGLKFKFRQLLGCNKHELLERFRSLYKSGMTDMNYGKWEIDHIRPICSFDLTKDEDIIQCFHYTNMQPLWREENQAKGTSWSD